MKLTVLAGAAFAGLLLATAPAEAKVIPATKGRKVQLGIDRLLASMLASLEGRRIGLLTHKAGVTGDGTPTADALLAKGVNLTALFAPEHGLWSRVEGGFDVANATYGPNRIPVFSLYGKTRRPTSQMLKKVDVVLVDLQDVGARFYTYISTTCYLMEEAAKAGVEVWVLDRPNPIGGERVDGKTIDRTKLGFTAIYPMPLVHGMTMGEMAMMLNEEYGYRCKLKVVEMGGWRRRMLWDDTGLAWIAPSPNLPTWQSTLLYPGLETIQMNGFIAEGRGTPFPFQICGATWIDDADELAERLKNEGLAGLDFQPLTFTPKSGALKGKRCRGVRIVVEKPELVEPMLLPLKILRVLRMMYPKKPRWSDVARSWSISLGLPRGASDLLGQHAVDSVIRDWRTGSRDFESIRGKYLLYKS